MYEALAPFAMWGAIGIVVLTLVFWGVGKIRRGIAEKAVAKQNEAALVAGKKLEDKADEVGRNAPKDPHSLRDWLRGGRV